MDEPLKHDQIQGHVTKLKHLLQVFESFVRKEDAKTLIVMDPPFGGMVEILAHTLKTVSRPRRYF